MENAPLVIMNAPILLSKEESHGKDGDRLKNNTQMAPCTLRILAGLGLGRIECTIINIILNQLDLAHNHNINIQQDTIFKLTCNLFSTSISNIYMLQLMRYLLDTQSYNLLCPIH